MSYEVEDEVDWSDGSLDDGRLPSSDNLLLSDAGHAPKQLDESNLQPDVTMSEARIGSPRNSRRLRMASATQHPKPSLQRLKTTNGQSSMRNISAQASLSKNGRRITQHQLNKDKLSKFVLYQANQKIYEAMFIKTFVAYALHPDRLDLMKSLGDNSDALAKIEGYLRDVSNNVNQLTNKMIWNAHFKTTNFLARPGQDSFPFININSFKDGIFNNPDYKNNTLIVQKMNQSWHRSYNTSGMVQHAAANYPTGTHYSPFEDIQEATAQKLLIGKGLTAGRVVKPPMKKRVLPGPARRDFKINPGGSQDHSSAPLTFPVVNGSVPQAYTLDENSEVQAERVSGLDRTSEIPAPNVLAMHKTTTTNSSAPEETHSNPDTSLPNTKPSLLEQIVAQSDPNISLFPLPEEAPSRLETLFAEPNMGRVQKDWRMRLIKDHKQRLAKRRVQPPGVQPYNIKGIVARAVDMGLLQHPTSEVQHRIDKLAIMESREAQKGSRLYASTVVATAPFEKTARSSCPGLKAAWPSKEVGKNSRQTGKPPRKKHKIQAYDVPLPPQSSDSHILVPHRLLPAKAYFTKVDEEEKPVWRCSGNHCMGYYYNAGDRLACIGCNTNIRDLKPMHMNFYLPSKNWFFLDAPGKIWKPSKQVKEVKKPSFHNAIAKVAWYAAYNSGATEEEAHKKAREAVLEHLRPKPKPKLLSELTPEPEPEPIDLGPHPSGSATMEHGQGIPECHSFKKIEKFDELAWRCDGGHALGRYYLAGDKKTCPGCGLGRTTKGGRRETMDFYMPSGAVVRQEAPELVKWHPAKQKDRANKVLCSHNQICTKNYWAAVEKGQTHEQALKTALEETDAQLDAKYDVDQARYEETARKKAEKEQVKLDQAKKLKQRKPQSPDSAAPSGRATPADGFRRNSDEGVVISLLPRKRRTEEVDSDGEEDGEGNIDVEAEKDEDEPAAEVMDISSGDESSSGSDSE
jgi:hypothetical protein